MLHLVCVSLTCSHALRHVCLGQQEDVDQGRGRPAVAREDGPLNIAFWFFVAIDTALFVALLVMGLTGQGHSDGGREMALIFSVILPAAIIALAVLLFLKAESPAWRMLALVLVAGPGLLIGGARLRSAAIDRQVRQNALGRGYFTGSAQKDAGEAVVRHDTTALRNLAPRIAVNEAGQHGMTLLRRAVEQAYDTTTVSDRPSSLAVVETLLSLGADANQGMEEASKMPDSAILAALLRRGGNPNASGERGPIVFEWLGVMPVANLQLLVERGLDLNVVDRSRSPLLVEMGRADRWDLATVMVEHGADGTRGDREGMTIADVVKDRLASSSRYAEGDMRTTLLNFKTLLDAAK